MFVVFKDMCFRVIGMEFDSRDFRIIQGNLDIFFNFFVGYYLQKGFDVVCLIVIVLQKVWWELDFCLILSDNFYVFKIGYFLDWLFLQFLCFSILICVEQFYLSYKFLMLKFF